MADTSRLEGATEPGPPDVESTPEQFAARWNARTPEQRAEWLAGRREDSRVAMNCLMMQHEQRIEQLESQIVLTPEEAALARSWYTRLPIGVRPEDVALARRLGDAS